ncbi:MAG: hypothetical protein J6112_09770 [Clostridia bacterium]|nr:hypothetical protein [Clostridia bacterium]
MDRTVVGGWRFCMCRNSTVAKKKLNFTTVDGIISSGLEIMDATVPGNLELDLIKAGKLPEDIFFGTNILLLQDLECEHVWYFTNFELEVIEDRPFSSLCFGGIDTVSEIYIDGKLIGFTENMLIPHEFSLEGIGAGMHELVVHVIPVSVYARQFELETKAWAMKYTQDSLLVRKAPAMYGWDIMPRALSAGLWKPVTVEYRKADRISDCYLSALNIEEDRAVLLLKLKIETVYDDLRDLTVYVKGVHKNSLGVIDSSFECCSTLFSSNVVLQIPVEHPVLWWPRGYGDPALYDVNVSLTRTVLKDSQRIFNVPGDELDRVVFRHGIRAVELERTSLAGKDGKFFFRINGKKIFVLGSNWVPTDTFPSRIDSYTKRGLELVRDIGCNMIRCWGGSPYPSDVLYDCCDENGIMVWQDFSMACGLYPDDERMRKLIKTEGISVVKSFRNHASLVLWSGDNENDIFASFRCGSVYGKRINAPDPNHNKLTREVLADVCERYDGMRPYIPSSPYLDEEVFKTGQLPSEDHLWGPRDFFKGTYYKDQSVAHFASETGYHGCPSPATLNKFISEKSLGKRGDGSICTDPEWLVHSASMETDPCAPFAYRVPLMTRQVEKLFGKAPDDIYSYALMSQISQAEAMKFFIEHFRIGKWYRSGIIWWNIIDGWPQISDAVVDWYGSKKLAYYYIKRSQQRFCLMCDEPREDGFVSVVAVSDLSDDISVEYTVTDAGSGENILTGRALAKADNSVIIDKFRAEPAHVYKLSWRCGNGSFNISGDNHFTGDIGSGLDLKTYVETMKKAGLWVTPDGF